MSYSRGNPTLCKWNRMRRLSMFVTLVGLIIGQFTATSVLNAQQAPFTPGPTVNCNSPEGNLQKTIDNTSAGSAIYVRGFCSKGPYFINKNLKLMSFDGQEPCGISSIPGSDFVLHIRGASVEIYGMPFDATNAVHGIHVENGSLTASGIVVENAKDMGILLQGSRLTAFKVVVRNSGKSGIHVGLTSTASINECTLTDNDVGVFITESSSANMGGNVIEKSKGVGVMVVAASSAYIVDTDMINGGWAGLSVDRLSNASLYSSLITGNAGPGVNLSPWYSFLSLRDPVNTIQGNWPDVNCNSRAILELYATQDSNTKRLFIDPGCTVVGGPVFP